MNIAKSGKMIFEDYGIVKLFTEYFEIIPDKLNITRPSIPQLNEDAALDVMKALLNHPSINWIKAAKIIVKIFNFSLWILEFITIEFIKQNFGYFLISVVPTKILRLRKEGFSKTIHGLKKKTIDRQLFYQIYLKPIGNMYKKCHYKPHIYFEKTLSKCSCGIQKRS